MPERCICITRDDIGVGIPAAYATWLAEEWRRDCPACGPLAEAPRNTILQGDVLEQLRRLPDDSVHCVVTSPPYWGLRDYKAEGQIGLEATPEEFVEKMVVVCREIRRVLRPEGTFWLNMGDSYAADGKWGGETGGKQSYLPQPDRMRVGRELRKTGLKNKDLIGQPWMLAFALRADGWYLRADIIWSKPNPMPESVTDRPTKAHEYVFLLSKSERYFYDIEAVREESSSGDIRRPYASEGTWEIDGRPSEQRHGGEARGTATAGKTRNKRSVWSVPTAPFPEAHFATFPPALIDPCIKAGTSEWGCCPDCGAPWKRQVQVDDHAGVLGESYHPHVDDAHLGQRGVPSADKAPIKRTTGWAPTCTHEATPVPCIVLDPFMGSGTTALVAAKAGRDYLGIELNPDYVAMAERRLLPWKGRLL
jgi:DNA modification methylase